MLRRARRPVPPAPARRPARRLALAALLVAGCALLPPERRLPAAERDALAAWRAGDAETAADRYRALAEAAETDARLWRETAVAAAEAGRLDDALAARRKAETLAPADGDNRLAAARLLLRLGRTTEGLAELGEPADAWGCVTRGELLRRAGRAEDSLPDFRRAAALDPHLALAPQELAEASLSLTRTPEAATLYADALALDRTQTQLSLRLAALESGLGRPAAAYERYRRYLLMDPGHEPAKRAKQALAVAHPELAAAEAGRLAARHADFLSVPAAFVTPLPPAPRAPLAVGIADGVTLFSLKGASAMLVRGAGSDTVCVEAQQELSGAADGDGVLLRWPEGRARLVPPVTVIPADPGASVVVFNVHFERGSYWSEEENRAYRGSFRVSAAGGVLRLVNLVPLEDYLLSVVPSEVPAEWDPEALKAQAVAARSETLAKLGRHAAQGYDLCATQHCAVYRGLDAEEPGPSAAVRATRGRVLLRNGRPLDAVYAANCGGFGSSPEAVWDGAAGPPGACDLKPKAEAAWNAVPADPDLRERFLRARPAAWCDGGAASSFRWVRSFTVDELSGILDRRYHLGALRAIRLGSRTPEGWLTAVTFTCERGERRVSRDAIRAAFGGIRSNAFTVEWLPASPFTPAQVILVGAGWGHGAGMCQDGLLGLAKAGRTYEQMLAHYYPGATLAELYP